MRRWPHRQVLAVTKGSLCQRSLNFRRCEAHAVALLQHLVGGNGLAVDADQVVLRPAVRDPLGEELLHGGVFGDLDVVGEACSVVVNLCGVRDYAEPEAIRHSFLAVIGNKGSA